jgi:hypothetical protein
VSTILLNETYENLDLGLTCETLSTTNFENTIRLVHVPTYRNNRTYLEIKMPTTAHVDIKFYDILGKEIGTLANGILSAGHHIIDVRAKINNRLSYGQYIYRISTGGQYYSKSILVK